MKSRHVIRLFVFATGLALAIPTPGFAAQQAPPGQNAPASAPQQDAAAAIAECAQAQPRVAQTIDAANVRIEAARQSNSPTVMRAAMDDLQGALGSLRTQLVACANLQAAAAADAHAGHVTPSTPNVQQSPAAKPGTPVQPQGAAPTPAGAGPAAAGGHAGHAMPAAGATNLVRDPRCTASVNPETAPRAEHAGQSYYFCSERDRQLFVADPVKYLQGAAAVQQAPPGRATTRPSAGARPAAPAAADPHAGHATPGASQPAAAARGSSAQPRTAPPQSAAPRTSVAGDHAGHAMPSTPSPGRTIGQSSQQTTGAAPSHATTGAVASTGAATARAAARLSSGRMPVTAVTELKCDGRVDPKTALRMLHQGRMYYFCSVEERAEFAKDPQRYVTAPPAESAPAHAH